MEKKEERKIWNNIRLREITKNSETRLHIITDRAGIRNAIDNTFKKPVPVLLVTGTMTASYNFLPPDSIVSEFSNRLHFPLSSPGK